MNENQIWWLAESASERADRVIATTDYLYSKQRGRYDQALANVSLYEGRKLGKLSPSSYYTPAPLNTVQFDDLTVNLARYLVNTARSQVASKQRPLSQFVTSGADWETKRRAKRLEEFCQAVKLQRQGPFLSDFWAVGLDAFLDEGVLDSMWIKFWIDWPTKQWRAGRVPPWQILIDPAESAGGEPQNLFHVYPYAKDKLAAETEDKELRAIILDSPTISDSGDKYDFLYGMGEGDASRMLLVREAWRLRFSEDEPGSHSQVIAAHGGGIDLLSKKPKAKPWKRDFFPFEQTCWEKWMIGIYGTSIVDNVRTLCTQVNETAQREAENQRLNSNAYCDYEQGSVDEELLKSNVPGVAIARQPGTAPINWKIPPSTFDGSVKYMTWLIAMAHDVTGINEQAATAQKQPGIESKVAIVEVENIGSDRLGAQIQNYERVMSVGADRQIVASFREMAEEVGEEELIVKYPGGKFFRELKWSKCSLEDNQFLIQPMAVSGTSVTPASRKEIAADLLDRGLIDGDQYKQVIQFNDIAGELEKGNAIDEWVDNSINTWLDVDEDDQDDPKKFRYKGPLPLMYGLEAQTQALVRVGNAYLLQDADDCPPWRLDYFLRFIDQTRVQVDKLTALAATQEAARRGNTAAVQQINQPPAPAPAGPPVNGAPGPQPAPQAAPPPGPPQVMQ